MDSSVAGNPWKRCEVSGVGCQVEKSENKEPSSELKKTLDLTPHTSHLFQCMIEIGVRGLTLKLKTHR
jgi:hypothetical protein